MKKLLLALLLFISVGNAIAQEFRVIGYLPTYRWGSINSIDFDNLTHVCYSFVNPDASGNFSFSQDLTNLKAKASAANCKVYASIAGAAPSAAAKTAYTTLTTPSERPAFIHKLLNYLRTAGVDGVDVDLEGDLVAMSTYNDFVVELADSCHAAGFGISAALARWNANLVSNATVNALDFINIMSYDQTGSWAPNNPGPHSTYAAAVSDFDYWSSTRAKGAANVVLGVPFYGYEFKNDNTAGAMTWCQIAGAYPSKMDEDQATTADGTVYYNGKPTIRKKTQFVMDQKGGGIMIWELGQDCFGANSLFQEIIATKNGTLSRTETKGETDALKVVPNPATTVVNLMVTENNLTYEVFNLSGKLVLQGANSTTIDISALEAGTYLVKAVSNQTVKSTLFIKQ